MGSRLELQEVLTDLLESSNVYFQPPPTIQMQYPCIVYKLDSEMVKRANNSIYNQVRAYSVTVIDRNPDSDIPAKVGDLPKARFSRFYTADDLNHFVYNVFF